ncbi:MAG TPA: hypothetical protein VLX12_07005 [Syntrophorhabdales bacterium]|nr:hypothetical protein [Syntrophorhabdales bacterium]
MSKWVIRGLQTGIKTTSYPDREETALGISPGLPLGKSDAGEKGPEIVSRCPTGALRKSGEQVVVNYRRCIHCFRCLRGLVDPLKWGSGYEWAEATEIPDDAMGRAFARSLHVRVVDGGACGACLSEIQQITKPYYNIHRLGFFVTPTPRDADILMVAGPVTDHMRLPICKAYEAMPTPKRVLAVGACALSGGVFGPSFASGAGVSELIPVAAAVPGCPPPPLAILHGLLMLSGRRSSSSLTADDSNGRTQTS